MSAPEAKTNGRRSRVPQALPPTAEQSSGSQLMAALLKVQAQAPKLAPNADGQIQSRAYRYVTLDAVVDAVLPLLDEHQLCWAAFPCSDEHGSPALRYRLTHVPSGEFEEDVMALMCSRPDPQGQGSAITYARRYALVAVLNLTTGEDDDGAAASNPGSTLGHFSDAPVTTQPVARPPAASERRITANQREKLLRPRAQKAKLTDAEFANVILAAGGAEPRTWETPEHASQTLERLLDQLPARLKDNVLERIDQAAKR